MLLALFVLTLGGWGAGIATDYTLGGMIHLLLPSSFAAAIIDLVVRQPARSEDL
ncbi:MAG: hypothetical protein KJ061_15320 [Vicinamibacteraceae bacterium]|nr:hypothetical protein [Vicinamibacteraceae bacterium]